MARGYEGPTLHFNANTFRVFIHCLLRANWKDKKWFGIEVKRGSFVTSRHHLAQALRLSEQQIKTALNHLESTGEITRSIYPKFSVITVVRYDDYQKSNQQSNQKSTNKATSNQPAINQQVTTTEERNKENKEIKKKKKPPRGWIEFVYHDSEWLRDHSPEDGWTVEELDGVYYVHQVKV